MGNHTATLQNILYIEDDEGLAKLLQKRLERKRFNVSICNSAEEGIKKLKTSEFDLILLDYHLPGMNGMEALETIVAMGDMPPIIILTASGDESIVVTALESGAADYAIKDVGQSYFDLLPAIMQAAFTKEQLLRENNRQKDELNEAKERAEAANQAKSNFLTTMSHEIRTPLNVVISITNLLSKSKLDEKQAKLLGTLYTNAELLLKLINDMLDLSRIEVGHVELESTPFDLDTLMGDLRIMFEDQAVQKGITLEVKNEPGRHYYRGDRTRLQQILMNLLGNAIKFTEKGTVTLRTDISELSNHKNRISFHIKDSGTGIPTDKLPTIFEKFTQADETITRKYGGSGLGLSIAQSLTKLMQGDITVTSEEGKGSIFTATVTLDTHSGEIAPKPTQPPQTATDDGAKNTVLLVEDYAPNVMVATLMLEELGFTVESADNGKKAIQMVEEKLIPYCAILMDVQMHEMDGLETTRHIRTLEAQKGHKNVIIGVTAHALAGDRERCISAGMDDYISKPINPDILASKMKKVSSKAA